MLPKNGRIAVFAPSPLLTITIEPGVDRPEVHLHAGGQGFWVARLAATLGVDVSFAVPWAASRGGSCAA
jgi:1-phosphofructokinase